MSEYSVAEARDQLSRLLDRVLAGEDVTITRRGKPIVHLEPAHPSRAALGKRKSVDLNWLRSIRVKPRFPTDASQTIRELRENERY